MPSWTSDAAVILPTAYREAVGRIVIAVNSCVPFLVCPMTGRQAAANVVLTELENRSYIEFCNRLGGRATPLTIVDSTTFVAFPPDDPVGAVVYYISGWVVYKVTRAALPPRTPDGVADAYSFFAVQCASFRGRIRAMTAAYAVAGFIPQQFVSLVMTRSADKSYAMFAAPRMMTFVSTFERNAQTGLTERNDVAARALVVDFRNALLRDPFLREQFDKLIKVGGLSPGGEEFLQQTSVLDDLFVVMIKLLVRMRIRDVTRTVIADRSSATKNAASLRVKVAESTREAKRQRLQAPVAARTPPLAEATVETADAAAVAAADDAWLVEAMEALDDLDGDLAEVLLELAGDDGRDIATDEHEG